MLKPEPFNYVEQIIRDADSYGAVLSEADFEITQIEPGCLRGRHVRFGLPGGQFMLKPAWHCAETVLFQTGGRSQWYWRVRPGRGSMG